MPDTPYHLLVARILTSIRVGQWRPGHSPAALVRETGTPLEEVRTAASDAARRFRMDVGLHTDGPDTLRAHLGLLTRYLHAEAHALRLRPPADLHDPKPERCAEALARVIAELGGSPAIVRDVRDLDEIEALRTDVAMVAERATQMLERGEAPTPDAISALRSLVGHAMAVERERFKQEATAHAR